MRVGVRPSEFWDLSPAEYNLIVEGYKEKQKDNLYRDLRNAYYTGCFSQVEKPTEFYAEVVVGLDSKPQTGAEIFSFLKQMTSVTQGDGLDSQFNIPLKLTPEFDVNVFNYIHQTRNDRLELYLPDVDLSMNNETSKPIKGLYSIPLKAQSNTMKLNYAGQVYTIMVIRS